MIEPGTIQYWRDGELIAEYPITPNTIQRCEDGSARVVIPPGLIELDTADELHFDPYSLRELLR